MESDEKHTAHCVVESDIEKGQANIRLIFLQVSFPLKMNQWTNQTVSQSINQSINNKNKLKRSKIP